jgi:DNA gyrase subunit A
VQLLALVEGEPRLLSLKRALQVYIEHRRQVITRRSEFELNKARARAHILQGLLLALANLDDVIQTIRESPDVDVAKQRLMERFRLSEIQAQAILDMQLRRWLHWSARRSRMSSARYWNASQPGRLLGRPRKIWS